MKKLTKREKTLIWVLVLMVILVGGFKFVVAPLAGRYLSLTEQLSEQEYTVQDMQLAIARTPALEESIASLRSAISAEQTRYYSRMTDEEVSSLVTSKLLQYSITPEKLTMGDSSLEDVPGYYPETAPAASYVQISVVVEASGTQAQMMALSQDLSRNPAFKLVQCSSALQDGATGICSLDLEFVLYMNA